MNKIKSLFTSLKNGWLAPPPEGRYLTFKKMACAGGFHNLHSFVCLLHLHSRIGSVEYLVQHLLYDTCGNDPCVTGENGYAFSRRSDYGICSDGYEFHYRSYPCTFYESGQRIYGFSSDGAYQHGNWYCSGISDFENKRAYL